MLPRSFVPAIVRSQVGALSLGATLNCDAFATAHSHSTHYDSKSFVGLAVILTTLEHIRAFAYSYTPFVCLFAVASCWGVHLLW